MRHLSAFLLIFTLLAVQSVQGQVLPGARARDTGTIKAEFLSAVLEGVRSTSTRWVEAISGDDAQAAAALYMEEALLVSPDGRVVNGRDDIRDYLAQELPAMGSLKTFLSDLDASNNMAMTAERFTLGPSGPGGTGVRGLLLTMYLLDDRT